MADPFSLISLKQKRAHFSSLKLFSPKHEKRKARKKGKKIEKMLTIEVNGGRHDTHRHTCSGKQKGNCRGCAFVRTWNRRKSESDRRTWSVDEPSAMRNEHQIPQYEIFEFQGTTAFINSLWLPDLTSLWINPLSPTIDGSVEEVLDRNVRYRMYFHRR